VKAIGDDDHMQTPPMVGKGRISGLAPVNACRSCSQVSTIIIDWLYWTQVRKQLCIPLYLHPHK